MPLDTMPGGSDPKKKNRGGRGGGNPPPQPPSNPTPAPPSYTPQPPPNRNTGPTPAERQEKRQEQREARRERNERLRDRYYQVRETRLRSRLLRVEDGLLGHPEDRREKLPVYIGERWNRGGNQSINTGTATTVEYGTSDFTVEQAGFPVMYDDASFTWTIPPGLDGVWFLHGVVRWDSDTTGNRNVRILVNGSDAIYNYRSDAMDVENSLPIICSHLFEAGDYFEIQVTQSSGGALNIIGGTDTVFLIAEYRGTA